MIIDELNIYRTKEELNNGFTEFIKRIVGSQSKTSISLSGGSTPKSLFDFWSETDRGIDWEKISFFWGDERCVAPDDEMSNYGMTKKYLFDHISIPKENIHRVRGENDSLDEVERYSDLLERYLPTEGDTPVFDIMILGLGDDGHTLSIFPYEIEKWNSPTNCIIAKHPETKMERVSLTGKVANKAKHVVFLVTGENKAKKIKEIIRNRSSFYNKYPAARVQPESGLIHWFLDEAAAAELSVDHQ